MKKGLGLFLLGLLIAGCSSGRYRAANSSAPTYITFDTNKNVEAYLSLRVVHFYHDRHYFEYFLPEKGITVLGNWEISGDTVRLIPAHIYYMDANDELVFALTDTLPANALYQPTLFRVKKGKLQNMTAGEQAYPATLFRYRPVAGDKKQLPE